MSRATAAAITTEGTLHARAFGEIENLLTRALDRPAFRRRWGFTRMRQSLLGAPGCFLWSNRRRGVHALEVTDARRGNDLLGLGPYLWFRLGIKYYPHPEEPLFEEYSMAERLLRLGPVFGEHGMPSPASSRQLRPGFFVVGFIECAAQDEKALTWLSLWAPDRWVETREAGLTIARFPGDMTQVLPPGGRDRNVPGWALAWPVFPPLVSAFCLESPARLRFAMTATRSALTTVTKSDGAVEETPASDTLERRYDACLLPSADAAIARRLDWAMEQLVSGSDGANSQAENRSWHSTRLPITRGRTTLPPIPKTVVR